MTQRQTTEDAEWGGWSADWAAADGFATAAGGAAADAGALAELRRAAARHRRRQVAVAAGEGLLTLALLALSVWVLRDGAVAWEVVWLLTLWAFVAAAAAFAWWNRRATWRAAGDAVEDYVRLARLRAVRELRAVRFAALFYAAEVVAVVAQLAWFDRLGPVAIGALAAAGVGIAAWCALAARRLRRELARIEAFTSGG